MSIKLWLDDIRPAPEDWVHVKSVNEAIEVMETGEVVFASLDHDLGVWTSEGGSGVKLTDWMAENDCWPSRGIRVHSSNPSGVQTMLATVDRYGSYPSRRRFIPTRGEAPAEDWPPSDSYV